MQSLAKPRRIRAERIIIGSEFPDIPSPKSSDNDFINKGRKLKNNLAT